MYSVLTLNKISPKGLAKLDSAKFVCSDSAENPDAIIVRSASMHEMELPSNLLAVARAGAVYQQIVSAPVRHQASRGVHLLELGAEMAVDSLRVLSRDVRAAEAFTRLEHTHEGLQVELQAVMELHGVGVGERLLLRRTDYYAAFFKIDSMHRKNSYICSLDCKCK